MTSKFSSLPRKLENVERCDIKEILAKREDSSIANIQKIHPKGLIQHHYNHYVQTSVHCTSFCVHIKHFEFLFELKVESYLVNSRERSGDEFNSLTEEID